MQEDERGRVLAGRRMYHVSMGLLEAGLYAVPISFVGAIFLAPLMGNFLAGLVSFAGWVGASVWVMRRAEARFLRSRSDAAPTGTLRLTHGLQNIVLRYVALAAGIFLLFTLIPLILSPLFSGVVGWIPVGGFWFFSVVILLLSALLFSAVGLLSRSIRDRLYPEYPGFLAALLFLLGMLALLLATFFSGA